VKGRFAWLGLIGGVLVASTWLPAASSARPAYVRPDPQGPLVEYSIRADGTGKQRISQPGPLFHFSGLSQLWRSSDGKRFVFLTGNWPDTIGLFEGTPSSFPRQSLTRLTPPSVGVTGGSDIYYGDPTFSPDGRWVAFTALECWAAGGGCSAGSEPQVYTVRTDGSLLRKIVPHAQVPTWERNGKLVYVGHVGNVSPDGHDTGVFEIRPDGTGQRRLSADLRFGALSPDGKLIAFICGKKFDALCLERRDGSGRRTLATYLRPDTGLFWSPAGTQLAIHRNSGQIVVMSIQRRRSRRVVIQTPNFWGGPILWSPDGRRLAFIGASNPVPNEFQRPRLYVATLSQSRTRFLTEGVPSMNDVRWSSPTTLTYLALGG
jgi:WD40-like Beta Propeller Repeat